MTSVIRIYCPYFCAGVVLEDGKVVKRAPILARHIQIGWTTLQVLAYSERLGWKADGIDCVKESHSNPGGAASSPMV